MIYISLYIPVFGFLQVAEVVKLVPLQPHGCNHFSVKTANGHIFWTEPQTKILVSWWPHSKICTQPYIWPFAQIIWATCGWHSNNYFWRSISVPKVISVNCKNTTILFDVILDFKRFRHLHDLKLKRENGKTFYEICAKKNEMILCDIAFRCLFKANS